MVEQDQLDEMSARRPHLARAAFTAPRARLRMGPVLCGALVACLGILLSPATCQAHGGGLSAGDYRTTIDGTMPLLAGATIRVREDDLIEVGWRGPGRAGPGRAG